MAPIPKETLNVFTRSEKNRFLKPRIFVTRKIADSALSLISSTFEAELWEDYDPPSRSVLIEKIEDVDGLLTLVTDKIDRGVLEHAKKLKIIAQVGTGIDNIDVKAAREKGIVVTNSPDVLTDACADYTFALILAIGRRVVEADRYVRLGEWKTAWHPSMMLGVEMSGATLGIVGAGRIGSAVARRAYGSGMKIVYWSRRPNPILETNYQASKAELEPLLRQSDFVSIHLSLTNETFHLFDKLKLGMMKKSAFLVNTSRGSIVDEMALIEALEKHSISGAALDVFEKEPLDPSSPLLSMNNVIVSPHISSSTTFARERMAEIATRNLISLLIEARTPPNSIN